MNNVSWAKWLTLVLALCVTLGIVALVAYFFLLDAFVTLNFHPGNG